MSGVAGKRSMDGNGMDQVRGNGARSTPGKATLTAALYREMAQSAPVDVSNAARAEVGAAFGGHVQRVDYAAGGGPAERRGANAVTIDGKVDFAPGQFDLDSHEGRARLGEETAHAMQQSNTGEPSSVRSLEGEAKQAGEDFAAGRTAKAELAAPAGVALADDPKDAKDTGPKDSDPSTEVPDLQHGEVTAIKKVISSNQSEALALMLKALQRIDAALFASTDLTDGKLHIGAGNSSTKQGSAFDAWLATYLEDAATKLSKPKDKLSSAEVTKAIKAAAPPADKKDITVTMGTGHFASTSLLYSSVRHEFVHVQQLRKDYLAHIPRSVLHQGVAAPESGSVDKDREVEAYLWEMENLANTGLKDPSEMKLLWEQCSNAFLNASPAATRTFGARFKAAFKNVWAKAMNGYVAVIADHYTKFKVSGSVADPGAVEHFNDGMDLMWSNKGRFDNTWSGHIASHKTALDQATEMITSIKADRFTKLLDKVDAEVAAGYTNSDDGFLRWEEVSNAWSKLETTTKTTLKTRYETTAPLLWEKTFDVLEAEIRKRIAADEFDVAQEFMNNSIGDLFKKAHASVKTATFQKRREALQAEITKARNAKKAKKP